MRTGIATLIKLQSWRCEQERRTVAAARTQLEALHARQGRLVAALEHERAIVRALPGDTVLDTTAYERWVRTESEKLVAALEAAAAALAEARERLAGTHREKRKLELAEAQRQRAEASAQARRERMALDEIALNCHVARNEVP